MNFYYFIQIEGAYLEDGKSLNNWDVFALSPGNKINQLAIGCSIDSSLHYHIRLTITLQCLGNIENGDNGFIADDLTIDIWYLKLLTMDNNI